MITNLHVEWVGDELRARWQGGDDPTVFVSGSPDDAGTVIVPVVSPGRLRVAGLPPGFRAFVHVLDLDGRWVVAGERLVRLGGGAHAVDLGGHRIADGREVGWGRLYAGDPVDGLDSAGQEALRALRVRTVADLRGGDSAGRPAWLDPDVRWELPGVGEGDASDAMQVAEVVTLAGDPANHAVLFHAAAGSDRAVVVAALVLSVLGVPDADLPFFPTRPEVLAAIRARSGSIEGYLTTGTGLGAPDLEALVTALVVARR